MISNVVKTMGRTAVKEGTKNGGIAVVIRNAVLPVRVLFTTAIVLEKIYDTVEKKRINKVAKERRRLK